MAGGEEVVVGEAEEEEEVEDEAKQSEHAFHGVSLYVRLFGHHVIPNGKGELDLCCWGYTQLVLAQ